MKKNVLITGTSTGVGFESAKLFAQNGYKVYATMRNLAKAKALQHDIDKHKLDITILELDVTSYPSIEKAVNTIIEKDGGLDILINNAGAGFAKTIEQTSLNQIDWVTDVNYTGVIRTTKAVLPHMRKAKAGHIINITSVGGLVGQPFNELYCGAKFAVEGFTEALASYISPSFNINFSLVEPGGIATQFMTNAIAKTADNQGDMVTSEYKPIFENYLNGTQDRSSNEESSPYQTAKQVADVILNIAQDKNPPLRIRTSQWAEDLCKLKIQADPDGTKLVNSIISKFL